MSEEAGIDIEYDQELAHVQAVAAEVVSEVEVSKVDSTRTIEFMGEKFRIADKIGLMPLLKFASASDLDVNDPRALAAMYAMLRDCIHPGSPACGECDACKESARLGAPAGSPVAGCKFYDRGDWHAFEEHAMQTRAEAEDLFEVITKVMEALSGRPTEQPASSSNGQRNSRAASTGTSSGRRGRGSKR